MKRLTIILMILAVAAGLGSCSAVRHCKAPEVDLPAGIARDAAVDSLTIADMEWWRFYGDSTLCSIIEHTLENNKDMLAAAARVERMRQLYRIGKAERLPSVSGSAYADHETNDYAGEKPTRDPEFGAKVTLSWELDLWGNLRWAKRKGGAEYLASVEDRRAAYAHYAQRGGLPGAVAFRGRPHFGDGFPTGQGGIRLDGRTDPRPREPDRDR